ncbi:MAG TPA: polyprenyl synthetase family protein [Caldilineaceae bacterium]|nr:polyprenyl synthetase family protein [Caldilineaceae bacterium]
MMPHPSTSDDRSRAALAAFAAELREVERVLTAAADELGSPLGDLVHAQLKRAAPLVRAALVLAAGYDLNEDPLRRDQRVLLAAALEMLYVALHIHRLLIDASATAQEEMDKSLIGSTILAGDYCFSRAATMAAQTDNPKVVAIFAQALQTVSEGLLRPLFDKTAAPFDEEETLRRCGVEAAIELAGVTGAERLSYTDAARALAQRIPQLPSAADALAELLPLLAPARQPRWQALLQWLIDGQRHRRTAPVTDHNPPPDW